MVWQFSGLAMVIYLAGLQGISEELDEARARRRRLDVVPLPPGRRCRCSRRRSPSSATLTLIIGLRVFDQVLALTGGGPVDATETLATQVYKQTFAYGRFGYGAALALILTALIAVLALTQLAILRVTGGRL